MIVRMLMDKVVCPYFENSFMPMLDNNGYRKETRKTTHNISDGGCGKKIKIHFIESKIVGVEKAK